jgi:hypothetical protein
VYRCMHQCHSRSSRFFLAILTTGNRFEAMSALVACRLCRDFVEAKGIDGRISAPRMCDPAASQPSCPTLPDAGSSKRRPANHPLRYTPHRWLLPGLSSSGGGTPRLYQKAMHGCPTQVKADSSQSSNPHSSNFTLWLESLVARFHCDYPCHSSAPIPEQTSLSYQRRRQKQTAQSPALAKVDCPVTSVSGVSSSPWFQALIAAII